MRPLAGLRHLAARAVPDADARSLLLTSVGGFAVRVSGVVLMALVTMLFTRLMGAAGYGRIAFLLSGSFIIVLFAGLGAPTAASRLIPRYLARGQAETAVHYFVGGLAVLAVTAVLAGCGFALALRGLPSLADDYGFSLASVLGLIVSVSLMRLVSEGSRAFGMQLTGFVAESVAVRLCLLVVLAAILAAGWPLGPQEALDLYVLAQALVVVAVTVLVLRRTRPGLAALRPRGLRLYKGWAGISLVMLVTPVYYFLLFETDVIVLGVVAGPYEVGLYQVARRLAELTVFCAGAASAVGLPRLARAHAERRPDKVQTIVDMINLLGVGSTAVIVAGVAAVGPFALRLFGPEFQAGYPALLVLAVGRLIALLFGPASDLLLMTGHHRRLGRINLGFAVLNIALNLALIPFIGILGAATATCITFIGWNIWLYALARRLTPVETSALRRLLAGRLPARPARGSLG